MASTISNADIERGITAGLREVLTEAGEAIIQDTLVKMEAKLRERLAAAVVGIIRTDYSVERQGNILQISVRLNGSSL